MAGAGAGGGGVGATAFIAGAARRRRRRRLHFHRGGRRGRRRRRGRRLCDGRRGGRRRLGRVGDRLSRRDPVEGRPEIGEEGDDDQRGEPRPKPTLDGRLALDGCRKNVDPFRRRLLRRRRGSWLREKSSDRGRNTRRNGAARRQKADDLRQRVSERGRHCALAEAKPARHAAKGSRAERAFDLAGGNGSGVRTTEPRPDLRSHAAGFKSVEETAEASWRRRDHRQNFSDKCPSVDAKPETAGQIVDQRIERRHVPLPESLLPG